VLGTVLANLCLMRLFRAPLLFLIGILLSSCSGDDYDLVVYASLDKEHSEPILRLFEQRTGLRVQAQYDVEQNKTVGLVKRIRAEKDNPYADLFWNNETAHTIRLQNLGLTQEYQSEATRAIPAQFRDPEGHWVGFAARARVILYRQDLLDAAGTSLPRTIEEMIEPQYANYGGMAAPLTGTTMTHFAILSAQLGKDRILQWLERAVHSGLAITSGNATAMRRVCQGDIAWCLTDTDDAAAAIDNGYPVEIFYPDQTDKLAGALLIPNTVCILKGARHLAAAQQFVDFLVSPEVEEILARSRSRQIPLNPASVPPEGLPLPGRDFVAMPVDWQKGAAELEARAVDFQRIFTQ
jgi:iron(III) transport system substrate-binding protein